MRPKPISSKNIEALHYLFEQELKLRKPVFLHVSCGHQKVLAKRYRFTPFFQSVIVGGHEFEQIFNAAWLIGNAYWDRNLLSMTWDSWRIYSLQALSLAMLMTLELDGEMGARMLVPEGECEPLLNDLLQEEIDNDHEFVRAKLLVVSCLPTLEYAFISDANLTPEVVAMYNHAVQHPESEDAMIARLAPCLERLKVNLLSAQAKA